MSSSDLHEVVMRWPHADANEVFVTGTFDQWSSSVRLERTPSGFEGPIRIPFGEKIQYKFIVDGIWVTDNSAPTEADGGFINNVYTAPERPTPTSAPTQEPEPASNESVVSAAHDFADQTLPAHDAPTPTTVEPSKPLTEEVKEAAAPVLDAINEAPTPTTIEPTKTVLDYAKGMAASFFPNMSPKSSPSSTPVPAAAPEPAPMEAPELAPEVPVGIVPMAASKEESEPTVVPGTTVVVAGEEVPSVASTHIPLPPPNVPKTVEAGLPAADVAPVKIEPAASTAESPSLVKDFAAPEPAPPVMAAEPVSSDAETPKEVVEVTPVAAVETAAAPASPVETKAIEVPANEEKMAAPEVLAAPPPEAEPKEVIPVASEPERIPPAEPTKETTPETTPKVASSTEPAREAAPEASAPAEPAKQTAPEAAAPAESTKETTPEAATPAKEEASAAAVSPKQESVAPTTPKKGSSEAPSTPPSNGHSRFGTLRSGSIRKFSFPNHRRSSSQTNVMSESVDKSPVSSVKDSVRKKRTSIFGKIKDVFSKDHKEENGNVAS